MSTRNSLLFSFLDRYANLLISIVSSMIIARLLTPAEIGVYSVTMVLLMFVATIRDMGAGTYLIQEKNLTTERIRAVWTVQLGLGLCLALVVMLASYPVALFYQEPRMRDIMLVISLNYAVNPFGSLTYAWLMREMRFESIALMRFTSAVSGAVVSTLLAWLGWGPISLAYGALVATIANALMAIRYRPASFPWLPGISEIKVVLAFGSKLMSGSIFGVLATGAPELLLGKLQDLTAAGFYSRSSGLVQMFNRMVVDAVSSVCLPWFSKNAREKGDFAGAFLKATAYVSALGWTFCAGIVCLADPVVRLLYGDQWGPSVNMARILAGAAAFGVPVALCNIALLSTGAVSKIARVTIFNACQTLVFVAIGASAGMVELGLSIVVSTAVSAVVTMYVTVKHIGFPVRRLFQTLWLSAQVVALASVGPLVALLIYGSTPSVLVMPLVVGGLGCILGFVSGVLVFQHPLQEELRSVSVKLKQLVFK